MEVIITYATCLLSLLYLNESLALQVWPQVMWHGISLSEENYSNSIRGVFSLYSSDSVYSHVHQEKN